MIELMALLPGEILYETAKFIVMILLLVCAVFIGGKLRQRSDAKKAAKEEAEKNADNTTVTQ